MTGTAVAWRSSLGRRAQVDPLVALPALAVLCIGLSLYAVGLLGAATPAEREVARPTLEVVGDVVVVAGVADPVRLQRGAAAGPVGYLTHVRLTADGQVWTAGPTPPESADRASRPVSVRVGPGTVRTGRLRVAVWRRL